MTAFDRAIASDPLGNGRFTLEVQDGWGDAGRAQRRVRRRRPAHRDGDPRVDLGRLPRTLALHFLRPLRPGPAEIRLVEEQVGPGDDPAQRPGRPRRARVRDRPGGLRRGARVRRRPRRGGKLDDAARDPAAVVPALALYADCWWPTPWGVLEETPPAPTIDLTLHFRQAPLAGADRHALCRLVSETPIDGFFLDTGHVRAADGELLVQSRQLALTGA